MFAPLCLAVLFISQIFAYPNPGPLINATRGEVWPKPQWQSSTGKYYQVDPKNFKLVVSNKNCFLLEKAISRYTDIIQASTDSPIFSDVTPVLRTINRIHVNLTKPCETLPHFGMDESSPQEFLLLMTLCSAYPSHLDYVYGHGEVVSNSIWGILRGLETLSQILVPMSNGMLRIPQTEIYDEPRFKYRGFMLDTARHFIRVPKILQLIDAMAYNKLNVFHWHLTDDSAFPYNSTKFPELSARGAYNARMTYSKANVYEIIEHARLRGIRVIPEFDTPAHTASWGASHPELLTQCYGKHEGQLGPMNPTKRQTFAFLEQFFSEIRNLFPDKFVHIGGDEVDSACWESNPDIQRYLKEHGKDSGDLPYMFFENLTASLYNKGQTPMLWQEAIEENPGIELPQGTIAHVWKNSKASLPSITKDGYTTILSDGFYLYAGDDGPDWMNYYNIEPTNFVGNQAQKNRVVGGEACLWTEWVNNNNAITMAFPRASAVAERLWSEKPHRDTPSAEAAPRLEEHNCRMLWRGIETRPANGYGLC